MDTDMVLNYMLKALFVYNFDSGVNFCRENFCGEIFFAGTLFVDREKKRKHSKNQNPQKFSATRVHGSSRAHLRSCF